MFTPSLQTLHYPGGETGVLLLHGYTSAPQEMQPMAEYLVRQGMTVLAPLLPGHGTSASDLNTRTWREVAECAADGLYELMGCCQQVFVGGVSMGGLLTLHLGQRCSDIAGLIPMSAAVHVRTPLRFALPFVRYVVDYTNKPSDIHRSIEDANSEHLLWSYQQNPLHFAAEVMALMRHVRDRLPQITQPTLIVQGAKDRQVPMRAARTIANEISSSDVTTLLLQQSGHCVTIDGEREHLFACVSEWICARTS